MPRDNNVRMPSSSAGVMTFSEDAHSKIHIKPSHVVIMCTIVIILAIILNIMYK